MPFVVLNCTTSIKHYFRTIHNIFISSRLECNFFISYCFFYWSIVNHQCVLVMYLFPFTSLQLPLGKKKMLLNQNRSYNWWQFRVHKERCILSSSSPKSKSLDLWWHPKCSDHSNMKSQNHSAPSSRCFVTRFFLKKCLAQALVFGCHLLPLIA